MNVEDSVWFEEYGHDQNYGGDTHSFEEPYPEAAPLSEADSITDTQIMDSALLEGLEQDNRQEKEIGSSQNPLIVTWLRNLPVMNYLDQVSESLLAEHILVVWNWTYII